MVMATYARIPQNSYGMQGVKGPGIPYAGWTYCQHVNEEGIMVECSGTRVKGTTRCLGHWNWWKKHMPNTPCPTPDEEV